MAKSMPIVPGTLRRRIRQLERCVADIEQMARHAGYDLAGVGADRREIPAYRLVMGILKRAGRVRYVACSLCHEPCDASTAHLHQGRWIGDQCCWDERLKASE